MTIYNKTPWKDHIVDSGGAVVQQGTPLSAGNLNRMEEGLANATATLASDLGAATAHSGVLDYVANAIGSAAATTAGQIYLNQGIEWANALGIKAFLSLITGVVVNTPATGVNKILLPAPPYEGTRDDFVFLEAWRDLVTQEWKTRFRVIDDVDFSKYPEGFHTRNPDGAAAAFNSKVTAQGGTSAPLIGDIVNSVPTRVRICFSPSSIRGITSFPNTALNDVGLYVSGLGDEASKSLLKTYDGYVYAIPLFKVNRRNSGGYSVNNPNGAQEYKVLYTTTGQQISHGVSTLLTFTSTALLEVGKMYMRSDYTTPTLKWRVDSIVNSTQAYVTYLADSGSGSQALSPTLGLVINPTDRPDGLYANLIYARDITDLRHKTYLVAPSYEQLLIDGTDQILRGASQVERKTAMRKTYVGVRKTPLDANHVFYASFDGTNIAEIGGDTLLSTNKFAPSATGVGKVLGEGDKLSITTACTQVTVEMFVKTNELFRVIGGTNVRHLFQIIHNSGTTKFYKNQNDANGFVFYSAGITVPTPNTAFSHIRVTFNSDTHRQTLYVNGKQVYTGTIPTDITSITAVWLGEISLWGYTGVISDFAVSRIDRGDTFATLPSDFIAGYADITPALSDQRRINSDAQTSQKSYAAAKVKNQTQERCITVNKGAGTNNAAWEAGDKIKVKGMAGEVISGVIDADTVITQIVSVDAAGTSSTPGTMTLVSVAGIAVNDTFRIRVSDGLLAPQVITVQTVDAANKKITFLTSVNVNAGTTYWNAADLIESTASSSSPVVRAIIAGTSTVVQGTWTGLGTNEAEVTLGTLPGGLAAQDIIIEYSLNMPVGQGSIYQVYTNVLGGEANGKRLILGSGIVTDDFIGKIAGSTTINPHKAYSAVGSALVTPTAPGTEFSQADYDAVKLQDGSLRATTVNVNGAQAQNMFVIDVIRLIEDKYGKIPGAYTTAEKVAWIVANTQRLSWSVLCNGAGPGGNNVTVGVYHVSGLVWTGFKYNTSGALASVTNAAAASNVSQFINPAGLMYLAVYADPSDGVNASSIQVDHITVSFEIATKAGYDTLVPENPRRDAGLGGVLYIRKTTREVESVFLGNDEDNGISVVGDYVPTQEMAVIQSTLSGTTDLLLSNQNFITTAGTNRAYGTNNAYANAITALLGPGDDLNYRVDPQTLVSSAPYETSNISGVLRYWYADFPHGSGVGTSTYGAGVPSWAVGVAEFLSGSPRLVLLNGEILLMLKLRKRSALAAEGIGGGSNNYYFRLPGRPLIKN